MRNVAIVYQPADDIARARDAMMAFTVTRFYLDYSHKDIDRIVVGTPKIPWEELSGDVRLFVQGFTPDAEDFARLEEAAIDYVWVDNDEAAVAAAYEGNPQRARAKGLRRGGTSMGMLAWESYLGWANNTPRLIELLDAAVCGGAPDAEERERAESFYAGLYAGDRDPMDPAWFEDFWKQIICFRRDKVYEERTVEELIDQGRRTGR